MTDREFVQFLNVVCVKFPNIASWFRNMPDDGKGTQDAWRKTLRSNGLQDSMDAIDAIHADPPRDSRGDLIHWENYPSIVRKLANEYARRRQPPTQVDLGDRSDTGTTKWARWTLARSSEMARQRWDAGYLRRPRAWQEKWNNTFREVDLQAEQIFGHKPLEEYARQLIAMNREVHEACMVELEPTIEKVLPTTVPLDPAELLASVAAVEGGDDVPF